MYTLKQFQLNKALVKMGKPHQEPLSIKAFKDYCEYYFDDFILVHYKGRPYQGKWEIKIKEVSSI